jgi:hypothetical protein
MARSALTLLALAAALTVGSARAGFDGKAPSRGLESARFGGLLTGTSAWAGASHSSASCTARWRLLPNPTPKDGNLSSVAALSPDDVWAVGVVGRAYTNSERALVEHWNGTSWQRVVSPNVGRRGNLTAVAGVASNDVWTAGYGASVLFSCGGPRYGNSGSKSLCGPTPSSVTFPFVKMATLESPTSSVSRRPLSG